jgi:hypothetical protein
LSKIFLPNFSNRPSTTVAVSRTRCKERKIQVSRILVPKSTGIFDFALLIKRVQVQPRNNSEKFVDFQNFSNRPTTNDAVSRTRSKIKKIFTSIVSLFLALQSSTCPSPTSEDVQ